MSDLTDKIRSITLNRHVDIMLLGDHTKFLLLGLWAKLSEIPNLYQTSYGKIICNIWDLADNADSTCRMFPMDGTVNTGFDYCIIVYDAITRIKHEDLDKWLSIKDEICLHQHVERKCTPIVIIMKTERTQPGIYEHVSIKCKKLGLRIIPVDNNEEGLNNIKTLLEKLSTLVFKERETKYRNLILELLK